MSIELKKNEKKELKNINKNNSNEFDDNSYKKKILEQKYRVDIIDAFGANTSDNIDNPVNFITNNNYIIYNVGYHILIKEYPPNNDQILSEKEMNKQSNSFFIYTSHNSKKITSISVSNDKNNFMISEEIEEEGGKKKYSTISIYNLSKINILNYYLLEPSRKIITDKYYNFKSINFSDDNKYLCCLCNEIINQKIYAIVYDIQEHKEFKLNETLPYIIIDLLSKIEIKNLNINDINNYNSLINFNKISFDNNNILCTSGNFNINFWYISNSRYKKIPNLMTKTKNFVDHSFYKFNNNSDKNNSILFTITSNNELFILQSSQKIIYGESNKSNENDEIENIFNNSIEQFIVKFYISNIFNDINCISSKLNVINNTDYFNGIIIGNNLGDIILYEKMKKEDINNLEYIFYKKIEKRENKSKCTSITFNYDKSLLLISYERSEISYCYLKNLFNEIRNDKLNNFINLNVINKGYHDYSLKNISISIQRPILITSSLRDNKIKIWNFISGYSEYCTIKLPEGQEHLTNKFIINCFALHQNGYNLAISDDKMIWFFVICHNEIRFYGNEISEINNNSKNNKKRIFLQKTNNCYLLKFSNGGDKLLAVNTSKNIFVISTFSREIINCFHLNHFGKINDAIFSSDDIYIYSFGSDGCIYEINIITEDIERIISTNLNYIYGEFYFSFNSNEELIKEKYYNILACGNDNKDYFITEIIYIPLIENKESKEYKIISAEKILIYEKITCIKVANPKKIEKKCIICGTEDGKIILFPSPFKDVKYIYDEVKTHKGRINKIEYISEINMIISCGDDGNIFIYSLNEILGETVLYDKRNDNIYQLNTTLDITLGNNILFPIYELEKIEINKKEEKDIIEKFEEEKEKISLEHENYLNKIIFKMNKKFEEEKKELKKKMEMLKDKLEANKEEYENELERKDKELNDKIKKDIKENSNKLNKYSNELKELKEKLKIRIEKYKDNINRKREDYRRKYEEIEKGFKEKIDKLIEDKNELREKYFEVKRDKKAFINNIEKESLLENKLRDIEQNKRNNEYKYNYENLNYDIIKYKDLIEKLEKNIKNKKKEKEELVDKIKYLEKVLDNNRDNNALLMYEKEKVTEQFKELQVKIQNNEINEDFNNKLRIELYKQKYELTSKFKEKSIENNIESKTNKSLSKSILNISNIVLNFEKDRKKAKIELELIKKENDKLRHELNINTQKLDKVIQKVFRSFQTHNKSDIIRCLCDIYNKYVNDNFILERNKKLLDRRIILELESQINTLEEQKNINKTHIKDMENSCDIYKEERIKENSILLSEFKNNRLRSQSLAKSINKLKGHSKLLSTEMSKIKKDSSILSSKELSKEFKKNNSTSEAFPPINYYKFKNTSSVLPSSIIKSDNDDNISPSKKGSFFTKSNESKIKSSDILSEHSSFED